MTDMPPPTPPSPWVARFTPLIADNGPVLDLACGSGRHTRYLADRSHPVVALDRNAEALQPLKNLTGVELIVADLDLSVIDQVRNTWQFYRDRRPDAYDEIFEK